jgi:hypothetical protein
VSMELSLTSAQQADTFGDFHPEEHREHITGWCYNDTERDPPRPGRNVRRERPLHHHGPPDRASRRCQTTGRASGQTTGRARR